MFLTHDSILTKDFLKCHSNILKYPWSRLWYLCRLNDVKGKGSVILSWNRLKTVLNCAHTTLWHWLREGLRVKAFQYYRKQGDSIYIRLGSKARVCHCLGLDSWGETAYVNSEDLHCLAAARSQGIAIATQKAQLRAYNAAIRSLDKNERKRFQVLPCSKIFEAVEASLCNAGSRANNFLLYVSKSKVYVSRGFIPYGASQAAIARSMGVSDRTVRRHLSGIDRRQVAQTKGSYSNLHKTLLSMGGGGINESYTIQEQAGWTSHYDSLNVQPARFFECMGKTWMLRCNLYDLDYQLVKERFARRKYKHSLSEISRFRPDLSIRDFNDCNEELRLGKVRLAQ